VIAKERRGDYLGDTVQVIRTSPTRSSPASSTWAGRASTWYITEVGGTVGDIESQPFLEAIRQIRHEIGPGSLLLPSRIANCLTYGPSGELKDQADPALRGRACAASASSPTR